MFIISFLYKFSRLVLSLGIVIHDLGKQTRLVVCCNCMILLLLVLNMLEKQFHVHVVVVCFSLLELVCTCGLCYVFQVFCNSGHIDRFAVFTQILKECVTTSVVDFTT